ncbi:Ras family protein [Onchocerca flexuosa]|uniref:Ras family protein n=1 Tax=Onchocerca flexuosa TaxID=387005 RepID=A0A238C076_9BILA|nr:Ras family protein [Onchocerca flexuosa]
MSTRVQLTPMLEYKIVLLGCGGVGKSALITQLIKGIFLKRYDPTIEDSYKKEIVVDGTTCTLEVLDTAGTIKFTKNQLLQEQFTAMRDLYMKNGDGFIVVYSITDASSLINTVEIFQSLLRVRQKYHFPLILVGNKCDDIINREVSRSVGERYAARYNSTFCEASAKNNIHVIEIFENIVKQIRIEGQLTVHQSEKERKRWYADNGRSMCCFI